MDGEIFQQLMADRNKRVNAFQKNPSFRRLLVSLYMACNAIAKKKKMRLEDMVIKDPHMDKVERHIRFEVVLSGESIKDVSPILDASGANIRRSDFV
jgi:hypothetical protein